MPTRYSTSREREQFAVAPSDSRTTVAVGALATVAVAVPADTRVIMFAATANFMVDWLDGQAPELSPSVRTVSHFPNFTTFNLVGSVDPADVVVSFYS